MTIYKALEKAERLVRMKKMVFFKIEDYFGRWFCYYNPSPQRLKRIIMKIKPKNVYVSVNKWLRYKENNTTYPNILFEENLLIDIDGQNFETKRECEEYFIEILNFLKEHKTHIQEIVSTNQTVGGFQLLIKYCCRHKILYHIGTNPLFSKIDKKVFDEKRVRRASGYFNGNKECYAYSLFLPLCFGNRDDIPKDLNITELENDWQDFSTPLFILPNFVWGEYIPLNALGMPLDTDKEPVTNLLNEADDNKAVAIQPILTSKQRQGKKIKSNLPCSFIVKQISNSVYGSPNNYVPVLKYPIKPSSRRIRKLQKTYLLGDVYLFQNHQEFVAISPKTVQKERLEKIYRKAGCWKSLSELAKFRQNWVFCSNIYSLDSSKILDTFKFIDIYENNVNGYYSKPHLRFLNKFFKKEYSNQIGTKLKVYTARFSTI